MPHTEDSAKELFIHHATRMSSDHERRAHRHTLIAVGVATTLIVAAYAVIAPSTFHIAEAKRDLVRAVEKVQTVQSTIASDVTEKPKMLWTHVKLEAEKQVIQQTEKSVVDEMKKQLEPPKQQ